MAEGDAPGEARLFFAQGSRRAEWINRSALAVLGAVITAILLGGIFRVLLPLLIAAVLVLSFWLVPAEIYSIQGNRLSHRRLGRTATVRLDQLKSVTVHWKPYGDSELFLTSERHLVSVDIREDTLPLREAVGEYLVRIESPLVRPGVVSARASKALGLDDEER